MFTQRRLVLIAICLVLLSPSSVSAGSKFFKSTGYFSGTYLLNTYSLAEYDVNAVMYPGSERPTPNMTFYKNGTVDLQGKAATYRVSGSTVTITYIPPSTSPFTTIQYVLYQEAGEAYWGEILFDGVLHGIIRGRLTN